MSMKYENEKKHLEAYRIKVDRNGRVMVIYKKSNSMKYGRVFCDNYIGAVTLRKEIRGCLFFDKYVDLDMCNCHPTFYYQIAKAHGIKCPRLEHYVTHREENIVMIQTLYKVSRDVAKKYFFSYYI